MSLIVFDTEIPTNMDALEVFDADMDELEVFGEVVWKKQKYYFVTFNSNGGTGSMNQQTMPVGVATALTANAFSRLGYLFANWAKSASGSAAYSDKQSVKDIAAAGETITLYALWTAITWYVVYNANGGSGSMSNSEHKYDTAEALTANAFTKTGYLFAGWDTDTSGNVVYADKASVKNLASTHGVKVNLYAVWTAITWYVKYNGNGATSGSMADSTHKYDTAKALTANAYSRTGYQFTGWSTSSGGAKVYDDEQSVKNLKSTHGAVLNLYAAWRMTEILTAGTWKSSATSVNNGVMSYNSEGYLAADISVMDGTATFAGPSFDVDVTGLSTISFTVYLSGYCSVDALGHGAIEFTINGKSASLGHYAGDDAITQTLSIDVSSMSGVQTCTCTMTEGCRKEEDEWGWSSNHFVRIYNIVPA